MPHAIYAHSAFSRDRFPHASDADIPRLLRATRIDVSIALAIAGAVNIALLIVGAAVLGDRPESSTLTGAYSALDDVMGPAIAILFAVGLLASSLASTAVGAYAGAEIMSGLTRLSVAPLMRRVITVIPALIILALGVEPTLALIISQVVLSFGIPFALVPLILATGTKQLMGEHRAHSAVRTLAGVATVLVIVINGGLIALTLGA
jgi:manganese transport protein